MSVITFEVREDGREYWYRYHTVELDTEDYKNIDEMSDEAHRIVQEGESEGGDKEYGSEEIDNIEVTYSDYDPDDEDVRWVDDEAVAIKTPEESNIIW